MSPGIPEFAGSEDDDSHRFTLPDVSLNHRPVRAVLDTGSPVPVAIFNHAAERLHIAVLPLSPEGTHVPEIIGLTKACEVRFESQASESPLVVLEDPADAPRDYDLVVGWPAFQDPIVSFLANPTRVLGGDSLPEVTGWSVWRLGGTTGTLWISQTDPSGRTVNVLIDTGDWGGVGLKPDAWQDWRRRHPSTPLTLDASVTLEKGYTVSHVGWDERHPIGDLSLRGISVEEEPVLAGGHVEASFDECWGVEALARLDLVVDRVHRLAYVRALSTPPRSFAYNRLGAVFGPPSSGKGPLVAHVLPGSPAEKAGIREGDGLISVSGHDMTHWRESSDWASSYWERQAGTQYRLRLFRDGQLIERGVTLGTLLPFDRFPG